MTQRRTGADGVIIGTALKRGDETTNPVSGERAAAIVTAARAAGSTDWSPIAASTRPTGLPLAVFDWWSSIAVGSRSQARESILDGPEEQEPDDRPKDQFAVYVLTGTLS